MARRYASEAAVLALDLDNFKYVNDSLGHAAGDELIAQVGQLLRRRLRASDTVARLGGDEFAAILSHADERKARAVAADLLETIAREAKVTTAAGSVHTSASIGIALVVDHADKLTGEELLVQADIALYDAKEAGRGRLAVFDAASERKSPTKARLTWAERIREALEQDRFVLHAQPIMSLDGTGPARYELLVRMLGEGEELIPPAPFLDVAERSDLIQEIDRWVIARAIRMLAEQQRGGHRVGFEVNLSAKSITDPALSELIACELATTGADPGGLVFEFTQSAAIVNIDRAQLFAATLRELGCGVAIDDFGAGLASFYYLKHFSFDYLKIDGEFVQKLATSKTDQLIVKSLVDIARGLGKRTIAEFVGDERTLELLRDYGIDFAQGFHVGRPRPMEASELHQQPKSPLHSGPRS